MKKFVNPEMEVEKLEVADVITASGCVTKTNCQYDLGE